jgi:DNA-binding CsgD family transcriptional regulator/tetratricopeptide (TPR) repeat protein
MTRQGGAVSWLPILGGLEHNRYVHLVEREAQLETLSARLGEAEAGSGRLVLVGGDAGAGKTALVSAFCDGVSSRVRVLIGRCDPLSTPRPLGPLLDVAAATGGRIGGLDPYNVPGRDLFAALLSDLTGRRAPTVLVLEDLQWADEATLDLIRFLGRRIETARALVIATYRSDETASRSWLRTLAGDLATTKSTSRLEVPSLSRSAVRELAAGSGLDPDDLYRRTGGNAFFVSEVVAVGRTAVPATISDAVLARVARLPSESLAQLETLAVIGPRLEPGPLADLVEQVELEPAVAVGLLEWSGGVLAFRHELAREAVLDSVSPARRRDVHRRVLAVLLAHTRGAVGEAARIAHHAGGADEAEAILEYAPQAAEEAARLGAHREAAEHYADAMRYADTLPSATRADLLERLALELHLTDRISDALAAQQAAVDVRRELGDPVTLGEALSRLSSVLVANGDGEAADERSREALGVLEKIEDDGAKARALANRARICLLRGDYVGAVEHARPALVLEEEFSDLALRAETSLTLGLALEMLADESGRDLVESGMRLAIESGSDAVRARAQSNVMYVSVVHELDLERAAAVDEEMIEFCLRRDLDHLLALALSSKAEIAFLQGRWDDALRLARSVLRRSQSVRPKLQSLVVVGRTLARRGEEGAIAALDEALALSSGRQHIRDVHGARAEAAWLAGRPGRTRREARLALARGGSLLEPLSRGELALRFRDAGEEAELEGLPEPYRLQLSGDWRAARDFWAARGFRYEAARAALDGDDEAALRSALVELEALGARPLAGMVSRRLRALGVKGVARGPRPSTREAPFGLTRRELEVLGLVAAGLRTTEIADRLYIAPKTVERHTSAIFGKLQVRSRTEAARVAAGAGLGADEIGLPN